MIKPTIGRVVWYYPGPQEKRLHVQVKDEQPCVALICYVHTDSTVNLIVFDHFAFMHPRKDVELCQGDTAPSEREYCAWMPYQKGQAAKTEALELKLAAS